MTTTPDDLKTCRCCKARRAAESKPPRILIPAFVKGARSPVFMCPHCDGDALDRAKALEAAHFTGE